MVESEKAYRMHRVLVLVFLLGAASVMLAWGAVVLSDDPKLPIDTVNMWAWPLLAVLCIANVLYMTKYPTEHYLISNLLRVTIAYLVGYVVVRVAVLGLTAPEPIDLFELESWYWQIMLMSLISWFVYPHRIGIGIIGLLYFVTIGSHFISVIGNAGGHDVTVNMVPFVSSYVVLGSVLCFSVALGYTRERIVRLDARATAMEQLAHVDSLTGVANRRGLEKALRAMLARSVQPLTLIMLDIDAFKTINDAHGHLTGDRILADLTRLVKRSIREDDVLGRWGGEEFLVMLPGLDLAAGVTTAERLRQLLGDHEFSTVGKITASFSVVTHNTGESVTELIRRADDKLLAAKEAGKDTVLFDETDFAS